MQEEPQGGHRWLERLVGEWTYESDCSMGPDKPRAKFVGTESVRSIGGLWVVGEGRGTMPDDGSPATMLLTLGFDPGRGRFVGTWIGSMMTHLWIYDGELDAAGKVLTLDAEGPDFFAEGKMARYRDVHEMEGEDRRVLTSSVVGPDGQWHPFVTTRYRRTR
jgi:hypothetical protein